MDSKLEAPGLRRQINRNGEVRLYWRANSQASNLGYEPLYRRVFGETDQEIASLCQIYQAEMLEWMARKNGASIQNEKRPTLKYLFRHFRTERASPFHKIKFNTRKTYNQILDTIENAVGDTRLEDINIRILQSWYDDARHPSGEDGPDHLTKAHNIIKMLRRVMSYGITAEISGCQRLHLILHHSRFEAPKRRQRTMSFEEAQAFIDKALELGLQSLALGTALQFECNFRQRDVIGEWLTIPSKGPSSTFVLNGRQWMSGLTWAHIDDYWRLTKQTTKTGSIVSHDLTLTTMAIDLLSKIPEYDRIGPLIIHEGTGRPYAEHAYHREWRRIADLADLPRDLRNSDARSGAATEADEAGASLEDIRMTMGHSDSKTTARYVRGQSLAQSRRVAELRKAHRNKD